MVNGERILFLSKRGLTAAGERNCNLEMGYSVAFSTCVISRRPTFYRFAALVSFSE